jgi:Gpi18-like mannosyltransferase
MYILGLLVVSTSVFILYISLAAQDHFAQLEPLLTGTAPRPYVYRVLTPLIVRSLSNVFDTSPFLVSLLVMYISLIGFSLVMSALTKVFLPQHFQAYALFTPIGLIPLLLQQRQIYDFPTLFLFTLALYFLAKNEFPKYIFVFVLATLSKETSLFLIILFVLQFRKSERTRFLLLSIIQIAVYVLIRLVLILFFRGNPGNLVEFHLFDHVNAYISNPVCAFILFGMIFSIVGISVFSAADESHFVKNSLIAIGGFTLPLYFLFGVPFEVRVFLEAYPPIFLMISYVATISITRLKNVNHPKTLASDASSRQEVGAA